MSCRLVLTAQAKEDVRAIYEHIAFQLFAPINAANQLDRIQTAILDLKDMPLRYRQFPCEPWKSKGLRKMPVDHFCVLYVPDEAVGVVTILRVMYEGRDMIEQLNQTTELDG